MALLRKREDLRWVEKELGLTRAAFWSAGQKATSALWERLCFSGDLKLLCIQESPEEQVKMHVLWAPPPEGLI